MQNRSPASVVLGGIFAVLVAIAIVAVIGWAILFGLVIFAVLAVVTAVTSIFGRRNRGIQAGQYRLIRTDRGLVYAFDTGSGVDSTPQHAADVEVAGNEIIDVEAVDTADEPADSETLIVDAQVVRATPRRR